MNTQGRSAKSAFNRLLAIMRRQGRPVTRSRKTRREEREKLSGMIAHHGGRFASVREAILSTHRVTTERRFCSVCDRVTDHRRGTCCSKHVQKHCPRCDKITLRHTNSGRCLEPTHREPVWDYCYYCQANRTYNSQNNCQTCGAARYSSPQQSWGSSPWRW